MPTLRMDKLKIFGCLIILFWFSNLSFAYDYPCHPPFLSSHRPYSLEKSPASLFLSQERAAFALELAGGEYALSHLFPWPEIEGYWHFMHKNFGGSVALDDRYQYTTREEIDFINPQGEYVGKGYLGKSSFIYTLRFGLAYQFPYFILGLGGDINYGIDRVDIEAPSGGTNEYHIKYAGYSGSYYVGLTILSRGRKPLLSMGYDSKVRIVLNDSIGYLRFHYLIPHQISVSVNFSMGGVGIEFRNYYRIAEYRDYYGSLQTIKANDWVVAFLISINDATKFYLGCYTFPLSYTTSGKGFGIGLGPKLPKARFLNEVLVIYETGSARSWEMQWEWRLTRYGIRLGFSL